jgi:hypothetical protein
MIWTPADYRSGQILWSYLWGSEWQVIRVCPPLMIDVRWSTPAKWWWPYLT